MTHPEKLSPEELAEIQRRHEVGESFRTTEARRTKKAGRQLSPEGQKEASSGDFSPTTAELYHERLHSISEANTVQDEISKLEAAGIKDRITWSQKLQESVPEKQAALTELEQQSQDVEQRLTQLNQITKGMLKEAISPQVTQAIEQAEKIFQEKQAAIRRINQELTQAEQVTDEEVTRYQTLTSDLEILNQQIDQLSSDSKLVELMFDEAKNEDEIRDKLISYALAVSTEQGAHRNPERDEFLRILCEKFISEELEAQGVEKIENIPQREQRIREITEGLLIGLSFYAQESEKNIKARMTESNNQSVLAGRALRNFIGALGTTDGALNWLVDISGGIERHQLIGYNIADYPIDISHGVERHLGSLNMLRGYMHGLRYYKSQILGSNRDMSGIDSPPYGGQNLSFRAENNGPILLKKAEPAKINEIRQKYKMYFDQAQKLEKKLFEKIQAKNESERARLNQEIAKIQEQLAKFQELEQLLGGHYEDRHKNLSALQQDVEEKRGLIEELQRKIEANQPKINQKVPTLFGKKAILDEIAEAQEQNSRFQAQGAQLERKLQRYQRLLELKQSLDQYSEDNLRQQLYQAQERLKYIKSNNSVN